MCNLCRIDFVRSTVVGTLLGTGLVKELMVQKGYKATSAKSYTFPKVLADMTQIMRGLTRK